MTRKPYVRHSESGAIYPLRIKAHSAWTTQGQTQCQVFVRPRLENALDQFTDLNESNELSSITPLLRRAWALQERLLSRRTIHFHAEELVWECKMRMWC
ncbi:hypothetical protein V8F06_012928 [Rhypophila decipiens]